MYHPIIARELINTQLAAWQREAAADRQAHRCMAAPRRPHPGARGEPVRGICASVMAYLFVACQAHVRRKEV